MAERPELVAYMERVRKNARHALHLWWNQIGEPRAPYWLAKTPRFTLDVIGGGQRWTWEVWEHGATDKPIMEQQRWYWDSYKARLGAERWLRRAHPDEYDAALS